MSARLCLSRFIAECQIEASGQARTSVYEEGGLVKSKGCEKGGEKALRASDSNKGKEEERKLVSISSKESVSTEFEKEEESRKEDNDSMSSIERERSGTPPYNASACNTSPFTLTSVAPPWGMLFYFNKRLRSRSSAHERLRAITSS